MVRKSPILNFVMEVAPSPILYPHKPSLTPALETIREGKAEGTEDDSKIVQACNDAIRIA